MIISRGQVDQNDENEEPVSEDKIKEKWTDEMIQDEIEKGTQGTILLVVLLLIRCTD